MLTGVLVVLPPLIMQLTESDIASLENSIVSLDRDVPVLVFDNNYLDVVAHDIDMHDIHALAKILAHYLPSHYACLEIPIDNQTCPFVRLYLMDWSPKQVTNFGLQAFLHKLGIVEISAACVRAVAVGSYGSITIDRFACLPLESYVGDPPLLPIGIGGVIQTCCLQPMEGNIATKNVAQDYGGSLEFVPMMGCKSCSRSRKQCSGGVPCSGCRSMGKICELRNEEWDSRARQLSRLTMENHLRHHDLAKYLLHHQAAVYGGYMLVSRDIKDISVRVAARAGEITVAFPEVGKLDQLPPQIVEWTKVTQAYKIEWMKGSVYAVYTSREYGKQIMASDEILAVAKKGKLAPKLVDGGRFNDIRRAYETWLVSLDYPGSVCEFKGAGCWKDGIVAWSKIRIISVLYENNSVVTLTLMYRKIAV